MMSFMESKYEMANKLGPSSDTLLIKEACLNFTASYLLIKLNQVQPNGEAQIFQLFFNMLKYMLQEIADLNVNKANHDEICFKSQIMTITNRFIILSPYLFYQMLAALKINSNDFISFWIQNMVLIILFQAFLATKVSLKINAFAILQFLKYFELNFFIEKIPLLLKYICP